METNSTTSLHQEDPQRPLRILLPLRLDVLGRAMDSGVWQMWLALDDAPGCEVVPYGPGFDGWDPTVGAGAAARAAGADVLLLGDLTHSIPGLWSQLWSDVRECGVPSVMFVSDPGSATEARIRSLDEVAPTAIMTLGYEPAYAEIDAAARERGIAVTRRHLGFDPHLFHPPADDAPERDIDILVCGAADPHAYPERRRIQSALRGLAGTRRVMDLTHPGYWETGGVRGSGPIAAARVALRLARDGGLPLLREAISVRLGRTATADSRMLPAPARHGQATFADLARRSKVVVTGTTFGIVSAKHYEVAACGAIGIGNMPEQDERDRLGPAMLVVDDRWDEARIAHEVEALLDDDARRDAMQAATLAAVAGTSHVERCGDVVHALAEIARAGAATELRGPAGFPRWTGIVAAATADAPTSRTDWLDTRTVPDGPGGLLDALAASEDEVIVLASSPEAALPPDATWLAAQVMGGAAVARRPMGQDDEVPDTQRTWALVAVRRDDLLAALELDGSIERAVAQLERAHGAAVADHPGFTDPAAAVRQLDAARHEVRP